MLLRMNSTRKTIRTVLGLLLCDLARRAMRDLTGEFAPGDGTGRIVTASFSVKWPEKLSTELAGEGGNVTRPPAVAPSGPGVVAPLLRLAASRDSDGPTGT